MARQYTFSHIWSELKGQPAEFSLHGRIFHSICIFGMVGLLVSAPINYFLQQYEALNILFIAIALLVIFYIMSRIAKRMELAIILFGISCNIFFSLIFLFAGGINGPNLLSFLIALFLMIVVSSSLRAKMIWCIINISILGGLLFVEYQFPERVAFEYETFADRLWDHWLQYVILCTVLYYGTTYIITNYEYERKSAADRAEAIRKQHLEITAQKEELERLNTEKDRLFSIIAHDLRSPLGNVRNYLDLMFQVGLEPPQRQYFEDKLKKQLASTSTMLANLLMWAEQQIKGVAVKSAPINLKVGIYDALEMEIQTAKTKGIDLELPNNDLIIHTDILVLQIIIRNLVNNALKFTSQNGIVRVSLNSTSCTAIVKVTDNGTGIAEKVQSSLFTLHTEPQSGTHNEKGVGLGLVLCKELTSALKGTLRFESVLGQGTTFTLELPRTL